ncbi:hypothetical protein [Flavobacterium alkalisoli]|uniref:hypothetical protein n=1 Tax=Flavobacterium alkalisoli TaxID=2602769 RepID=UPI003A936D52
MIPSNIRILLQMPAGLVVLAIVMAPMSLLLDIFCFFQQINIELLDIELTTGTAYYICITAISNGIVLIIFLTFSILYNQYRKTILKHTALLSFNIAVATFLYIYFF